MTGETFRLVNRLQIDSNSTDGTLQSRQSAVIESGFLNIRDSMTAIQITRRLQIQPFLYLFLLFWVTAIAVRKYGGSL